MKLEVAISNLAYKLYKEIRLIWACGTPNMNLYYRPGYIEAVFQKKSPGEGWQKIDTNVEIQIQYNATPENYVDRMLRLIPIRKYYRKRNLLRSAMTITEEDL